MGRVEQTHVGAAQRVRFSTADSPDYLFSAGPFAGGAPPPPRHSGGTSGDLTIPHYQPQTPTESYNPSEPSHVPGTGGRPASAPRGTAAVTPLVDLSGGGSSKGAGGLVHLASPILSALDPVVSPLIADVAKPFALEEQTIGNQKLPAILAAAKQTPEFTSEGPKLYSQAYKQNAPFAVKGPYQTPLAPHEEQEFQQWVSTHNVPFDPNAKHTDYDMRGYWKATGGKGWKEGEHFPDTFKTPLDTSFSAQSKYATPNNPLEWKGEKLVNTDTGQTVFGPKGAGLQPTAGGRLTTPAVRQALQGVNQATDHLQKTARPDLAGLSPQERSVVPYVMRAHHEYPDVPSSALMSDIRQESAFNPLAKSPADAQGLSQFIPGTAAQYGVQYGASPQAQQSQVTGQAHYLHDLGFGKDPQAALSSYSGGYAASAYNNPVLQGAHDYAALDKPSKPTPQAVHQYQRAAADAQQLGLHPTSPQAAAKPWGGDLEPSLHPNTVYVRADGRGMVHWAESALGTKEGSPRQLNINAKSGISPSEPWCAAFIAAGLRRRGVQPPSNPAYSGNYLPQSWPGAKSVGTDLSKAKPGDVVIFGANEHIGLYAGSGQIIAGNWGNEVAKYPAVSDSRGISAIVRPPYKGGKVAVHSATPLPGGSPSSTFGAGVGTAVAAAGGSASEAAAASQASQVHPAVALTPLQAPAFSAGPTLPTAPGAQTPEEELLALLTGAPALSTSGRRQGLVG